MFDQSLGAQARSAYEAAVKSPFPDWRAVAEMFRAAMGADRVKRTPKSTAKSELADYGVDRVKLRCRSPRIVVRFMDGEAVFTHVPSVPGRPLNKSVARYAWPLPCIASRKEVQRRAGFMRLRPRDPRA